MTPQYILRKSLCRAPSCNGPYELRNVPFAEWPATTRAAAIRSAENEIENMQSATQWAEGTGNDQPRKAILIANWNHLPRGIDSLLESYGYSIEWNDTVTECDGCYKLLQTTADSCFWQPAYITTGDGCYCIECLTAEDIESLENDPDRAVNIAGIDLTAYGYVEIQCGFESGWHPGQNDDPKAIYEALKGQHPRLLFQVSDQSQFYIGFCVWHKPEEQLVE